MITRDFKFDLKAVGEAGTFEGFASVTGNKDLAGDVIEPGAFKRTISHKNGKFPLLWQHDTSIPIGIVEVEEREKGLFAKGVLNLEVEKAREARALAAQGVLGGMSIGFEIPKGKSEVVGGVRRIKEVKLWEVSMVTFPANPKATITSVKNEEPEVTADDIKRAEELVKVRSLLAELKGSFDSSFGHSMEAEAKDGLDQEQGDEKYVAILTMARDIQKMCR